MTPKLASLTWDAHEPLRLARFWAAALEWEISGETHGKVGLTPADGTCSTVVFVPAAEEKAGANRIHLDLSSRSVEDQRATAARLIDLGASEIDIWDQDDETAIRAPDGTRQFITWGGPPLAPRRGKNRPHLDVAPPPDGGQGPRSSVSCRSARSGSTSARRGVVGRDGRPRRQRVLRPDSEIEAHLPPWEATSWEGFYDRYLREWSYRNSRVAGEPAGLFLVALVALVTG